MATKRKPGALRYNQDKIIRGTVGDQNITTIDPKKDGTLKKSYIISNLFE